MVNRYFSALKPSVRLLYNSADAYGTNAHFFRLYSTLKRDRNWHFSPEISLLSMLVSDFFSPSDADVPSYTFLTLTYCRESPVRNVY